MRVLFMTAEAYPFVKVGGLGDVAWGLPSALKDIDVDIRLIMPKYKFPKSYRKNIKIIARYKTFIGWKTVDCTLGHCKLNGLDYYFVDNPEYFYRKNVYGYGDDDERFIFFCKAALEGIKYLEDFTPDIVHSNDWHSALGVTLKDIYYKDDKRYKDIKTVFTIHNMAYQGQLGRDALWMLGIDEDIYYNEKELKYHEGINLMKWAINKADMVTTVSPTYANEVKESYYGFGLSEYVINKGNRFNGILNGIDYSVFNPQVDKSIYKKYDENSLENKKLNKLELQRELELNIGEEIPLISMICRLTNQKGVGLLISSVQELIDRGMEVIISGRGEECYEEAVMELEKRYKGRVKGLINFDMTLANKIYAASDMFLIPSKFEPCGLTQMISMKYGTIPIVRSTGGLKDTVREFNLITNKGNGFTFKNYDCRDMIDSIDRALQVFRDKESWSSLVLNAIREDNSWGKSAEKYKELYYELIIEK